MSLIVGSERPGTEGAAKSFGGKHRHNGRSNTDKTAFRDTASRNVLYTSVRRGSSVAALYERRKESETTGGHRPWLQWLLDISASPYHNTSDEDDGDARR